MGKKTDNHYLADKVELRCRFMPENCKVLDVFGGHGRVWKAVELKSQKKILRVAIDRRDDLKTFHLHGDVSKVLPSVDLTVFNAIDVDAYGIPYDPLKEIFDSEWKGRVFVTAIQSMYGRVPDGLLYEIGFSPDMIKKAPSLMGKRGFEYFLEWLAIRGVREIHHRSKARKHYLTFLIE